MMRSLTGKLGVSIGVYLLVLIIVAAYALASILTLRRDVDFLGTVVLSSVQQSDLYRSTVIRAAGEASVFAAAGIADEYDEALEALEVSRASLAQPDPLLKGEEHHHEPHVQNVQTENSFYDERLHLLSEIESLITALPTADEVQREQIVEEIEDWEEAHEELEERIDALITEELATTMADVNRQQSASIASIGSLLAVCTLFSGIILISVHRLVAQPLQQLSATTTRVARGDFSSKMTVTNADEVGALQQNFNTMTTMLAQQTRDLAQQIQDLDVARMTAEAAQAEVANQLTTITAQHDIIREMSVPVLPVSRETLVMPLVGALDSARLAQVQEQALGRLEATRARRLLLDITGVPVVDSQVAQGLISVVQAARLLGAEVSLVGIRPEVAQAIVGLGLNLGSIRTHSDLQSALVRAGGVR